MKTSLKMAEMVKKLLITYNDGSLLESLLTDIEWSHRELYAQSGDEKERRLAIREFRSGYYLALARGDNSLAEIYKEKYKEFWGGEIEIN